MVDLTTFFSGTPVRGPSSPRRTNSNGSGVEGMPTQESPAFDEPVDTYVPGGQTSAVAAEVISDFYTEVLDNPDKYPHLIRNLTDAVTGEPLEYTFEITPEMKQHVANLRARFPEESQTQRGMALLLLRSIVPPNRLIAITGERRMDFVAGLPAAEGGQEIRPNDDRTIAARVQYGDITPSELLNLPPEERIALCLEYSQLLVCLLRAAGIEANVREVPRHAYVIATTNEGENYILDAGSLVFDETPRSPNADSEAVAMHYANEASMFRHQGRLEEALQRFDMATLLYPESYRIWHNRGGTLRDMGRFEEALSSYDRALELNPLDIPALIGQAYTLTDMGRIEEAQVAWQAVLEIEPDCSEAQEALANLSAGQ